MLHAHGKSQARAGEADGEPRWHAYLASGSTPDRRAVGGMFYLKILKYRLHSTYSFSLEDALNCFSCLPMIEELYQMYKHVSIMLKFI